MVVTTKLQQFKTSSRAAPLLGLACALAAWHGGAGAASELLDSPFHFDAFGTLGLAWSDVPEPGYLTHQANTVGINSTPTARPDSRLGLQLGWTLSDQVEINVQGLLSDYRAEDKAQISWAYLRAQITPEWDVKVGRFRLPTYMYADTLDIGYAYPWVRPPVDVYSTSSDFHSADGLMLRYKHPLETGYLQIEPFIGYGNETTSDQTQVEITLVGAAAAWVRGPMEMHGSITSTKNAIYSPKYQKLVDACTLQGSSSCGDYDIQHLRTTQSSLGLRYDDSNWMFASELAYRVPSSITVSKALSGFVSVGHYFGTWLPYATYSWQQSFGPREETRNGALNPAFTAVLKNKTQQHTWSLGTRWDVQPGIALKVQLDNVHPDHGSPGTFTGHLPTRTRSVNVYSLALDWTY